MNKEKIKNWPQKSGIYLMMDKKNRVIYIGKAKNLKSRVRSYFSDTKSSLKTQFLMNHAKNIDYILTDTESQALILEASLVKQHKPRYNVQLKDDKAYPYIRLSLKDPFPRFYLERKVKKDGSVYFGPYTGGGTVRNLISFLNENYQIRDCGNSFMKSRKTPCLTHQMGYCTAPCTSRVSEKQYAKQVHLALSFLKSGGRKTVEHLTQQMKTRADKEQFEQALEIKNKITSIKKIWESQPIISQNTSKDCDIFAFSGNGLSFLFYILHIRSGCLIGQRSYFEKKALWQKSSKELKDNLTGLTVQYYSDNIIPDSVVIPPILTAAKKLESVLESIKGSCVQVHFPKGKQEKIWFKMAEKNAENKLKTSLQQADVLESALLEIQKKFNLLKLPHRIECYDISHHQSKAVYASQVVFEGGLKKTQDYRLYKMKEINDDYMQMKEVLSRRLAHQEMDLPDMILIDGGKGQLTSALQILKEKDFKIPVVCITKNRYENVNSSKNQKKSKKTPSPRPSLKNKDFRDKFYIAGRKNPIHIPENKKAYQILASLRNEAHRLAISHHRKKLAAEAFKSQLDDIRGIGEKRKLKLFKAFGSMEGMVQAEPKEVAKVLGLSMQKTMEIMKHFKTQNTADMEKT